MFNNNLASNRRRLFLTMFICCFIVGFGTKYLLAYLGWTDRAQDKSQVTSIPTTDNESAKKVVFSKQELAEADKNGKAFLESYLNDKPTLRKERLHKLKSVTAPFLYRQLAIEAITSRTGAWHTLLSIEQKGCEQNNLAINCNYYTVIQDNKEKKWKRVFVVKLMAEHQKWLVQEVTQRGSLE